MRLTIGSRVHVSEGQSAVRAGDREGSIAPTCRC